MVKGNDLAHKPIKPLLWGLAIPAIIAQLVNIVYNMVDRIYIGNMAGGTVAMAGLSVALPIVTLIMAFTQLVGVGGAPLAAIQLGKGNHEKAEKIMTNSFVALLIQGTILTIIISLFKEPLLMMFGADMTTIAPALEYVSIYVLGTVFVQISIGMNSYITTQGYAKFGMATVLIGAILNIFLDPIFIFGFDMGVSGAALATIISQAVSAIWVLVFFKNTSRLKLRMKFARPSMKVLLSIMALGISPFIMQFTESLLQISFNNQLSVHGGSTAVATMAILMSLYQMMALPLIGFCMGAQPILSYNYGAKNFQRVKETFKFTIRVCLSFSITAGMIVLLGAPLFVRIFSQDPLTIEYATWAIRVFLCGTIFFGAQLACQQAFMALGQAKSSLSMAIFRKVIMLIPLIYVLPILIGDNEFAISMGQSVAHLTYDSGRVFAILVSESIADFSAAIVTSLMFYRFYKKHLCVDSSKIET